MTEVNVIDVILDEGELLSFTEKQQWLDEKIQFLQTLPPIEALSPLPPLPSIVTVEELENWWTEHDKIEVDVENYNLGDLKKLKEFAKNTSKKSLSSEDTEIIELLYATLLSVDKLFNLLRQRKKALTLLDYRLKWETQITSAWTEHRKIIQDLPRFLKKSRWTIPSELNSRSRNPSLVPASPPASGPIPLRPHSSPSSSPSPKVLSLSLASLINPNSTPPRANASSAMSRAMRSEVLSLELASQKSRLHSLTQSTLPATAICLDKLIDTSPTPLPDAFLDDQERLEEASKTLTEGLASFLTSIVTQWRNSDEIFWSTRGIEMEGENLMRDLEEALLKLPDRTRAESFEKKLKGMVKDLKELEEKRGRKGFLPLPYHSSVEDQGEENSRLVKILEKNVKRSREVIQRSQEAVEGYQFAVTSLEESREIRKAMELRIGELNEFLLSHASLSGRLNLSTLTCLSPTSSSILFSSQLETLSLSIQPSLSSVQPLLLQASNILVNLTKAGLDPNVKQTVREIMGGLTLSKEKVAEILRIEELERKKIQSVIALEEVVEIASEKIEAARETLESELEQSRWSTTGTQDVEHPTSINFENLRSELDSILSEPLSQATSLLDKSHPVLSSHLQSQLVTLLPSFDLLLQQQHLLDRIRAQTSAILSVVTRLGVTEDEIDRLGKKVLVTLGSVQSEKSLSLTTTFKEDLEDIKSRFEPLNSSIFQRIPFLQPSTFCSSLNHKSTPSSLSSLLAVYSQQHPSVSLVPSFDLSSQDEFVRTRINERVVEVVGRIEGLKTSIDTLDHQLLTNVWDKELEIVEAKLNALVKESHNVGKGALEGMDDDAIQSLISVATIQLSSFESSRSDFDQLSITLKILQSNPISSSPSFKLHSTRQITLDALSQRLELSVKKLQSKSNSCQQFLIDRKVATEGKGKVEEGEEKVRSAALELARVNAEKMEEEERFRLETEARKAEATRLLEEDIRLNEVRMKETVAQEQESILSTISLELDQFEEQLESLSLLEQSSSILNSTPAPSVQTLELARNQLLQDSTLSNSLSKLMIIDQELGASQKAVDTTLEIDELTKATKDRIVLLESQASQVAKRLDASVATASTQIDLEDVFGPTIIANPFPSAGSEEEDEELEKSPMMKLELLLASIPVDEWTDVQPFLQLPTLADAELLHRQLSPIYSQLHDLCIDSSSGSPELDAIRLELERKTIALNQVDSLAQFKSKVESADDALSNLLTSIDYATPGMKDELALEDGFDSPTFTISESLGMASKAITVVRKDAIHLLEDSRVVAQISRIEATFEDMMMMVEDLNPTRSLSSASVSSTNSFSRIPTPTRSFRSTSTSSTGHSSLFSTTAKSSQSSRKVKPSLQSHNGPTPTPRKRTTSETSSSTTSVNTPRQRAFSSINPITTTSTPRAFIIPSAHKNAFNMSFGQSSPSSSFITTSKRDRVVSPTASSPTTMNQRDRFSVSTSRNYGLDTSPTAFSKSTPRNTNPASRRSTMTGGGTYSLSDSSTFDPNVKRIYKANLKRKVDVEVARIVNEFPLSIYVKAAHNAYEDESGNYWIGEKLYFCRVLRSRNVLVRIGGGYQHLSEFLRKHFGSKNSPPSKVSLSTSSLSLSRISPTREGVKSVPSTPRSNKAPIAPWKF